MQASHEHIASLERLQELDRARWQAENQLKDMPHRQKVLDGRAKRKEVAAKFDQVSDLLFQAKAEQQKLLDEDERLCTKQAETQQKIDEAQGDYRAITTLTRDLEGMHKRRETLGFLGGQAQERLSQVQQVYDSAKAALEQLDAQEQALVADYQAKTEALSASVKQALSERASLVQGLPSDIVSSYNEALSRCGGVGLARLQGDTCSTCRATIDANRMLQVRREAPLSHCPHCKRLLIVE